MSAGYGDVVAILKEAGAPEEGLKQVERVLKLLERDELSPEDAFLFIMGLCRERLVPLTPLQVSEVRLALGLPRE